MTPAELTQVLLQMPPRSAQVLGHRFLHGLDREGCAKLYGITADAFDVLLLRAARDFQGKPLPETYDDERREAALLRVELEQGSNGLLELFTHRDEVRRLLHEAEERAEASPERKRETALRWLAIIVIAVLGAYFMWKDHEREQNKRYAPYLTVPAPDAQH
jgi:hypothetical protein